MTPLSTRPLRGERPVAGARASIVDYGLCYPLRSRRPGWAVSIGLVMVHGKQGEQLQGSRGARQHSRLALRAGADGREGPWQRFSERRPEARAGARPAGRPASPPVGERRARAAAGCCTWHATSRQGQSRPAPTPSATARSNARAPCAAGFSSPLPAGLPLSWALWLPAAEWDPCSRITPVLSAAMSPRPRERADRRVRSRVPGPRAPRTTAAS